MGYVHAYRLFKAARETGATPWEALRTVADALVPLQIRMLVRAEHRNLASLALWVRRRQDGVAPGATALAYAKSQRPLLMMLLFAVVVQAIALEWMLAASNAAPGLRAIVMAADVYQLLFVLALGAASTTRPHVVTAEELRIRYGGYFDLRVPRELIASVKVSRNYNARGVIKVTGGRLTLGVDAQTNLIVNLTRPIAVTRPLGRREHVTTIQFYADDPGSALRSLEERS
uniref:Possible integral membrane protein n=2 Tax=Nonomuraea gerenzanensis TaxID=93944 RepID=A0A1M4EDH2_9ACTN|nr:possible integral membrane protein [Nonomuraea gerenzanensis]